MLINWFTVIAQIVNFLILVWLLKRYLYKPVLKAVDEREKRIAAQINDAAKKEADAENDRNDFITKKADLDKQREDILAKAEEDAKANREKLLEDARKEATALQQKLADKLDSEQEAIANEIAGKTKTVVFEVARKALLDLADADLESRIVQVFVGKVVNLGDNERKDMRNVFAESEQVMVSSSFTLSEQQKNDIKKVLDDTVGKPLQYAFETSKDLISGIELYAGGFKIAWNIDEFLRSAESEVDQLMKKNNTRISNDGI